MEREIKFEYILLKNDVVIGKEKLSLEEIEQKNQNEFCYDLLESDERVIKRQYTGRIDKNGVEIYEGDIAIIENYNHHGKNPKKTMFIYYDNLTAQYCCRIKETVCKIDDLIMEHQPLCFAHSIEIIGNIYENQDLLKG